MRSYSGYERVNVGDVSQKKLEKALKTGKLSLSKDEVSGGRIMLLHPANAKKIRNAQNKKTGLTNMQISGGEILADIQFHDMAGGNLSGGSVWKWLKNAGKSVYKFAKDNWDILKPVMTKIADVGVPAMATYLGQPQLSGVARSAVKDIAGVGIKEKMAKVRSYKKNKKVNVMDTDMFGGSFRIN